jgi:hypothetical protein
VANIKIIMVLVFSNTFFNISFHAFMIGVAMTRDVGTDLVLTQWGLRVQN